MHRRRAGRIGLRSLHAAVGGTGAPADDRLGVGTGFLEDFHERATAVDAEHAIFVERRIAFDGNDVVALVLLLDLFDDRLGLMACCSHQRVVIVEREHGEHDILGQRVRRADEGFGAAGAFQAMQPDHGRARLGFQRMGNARRGGRAQPERGRRQAAEFQETAPGNALAAQYFIKGLGHWSVPRWFYCQVGATTQGVCQTYRQAKLLIRIKAFLTNRARAAVKPATCDSDYIQSNMERNIPPTVCRVIDAR